jgi:4-amino-4-deoxy-L-arabinose transferase-like glycosyltransferase
VKRPLPVFLLLQALLGFWNLGLLSPWMDEAATLILERGSPAQVATIASHDVHPPGFYLLLWMWQRLPLGFDESVQARMLTVLIGLAATIAADRLLGSRLTERRRVWFLALWCLSPCFLLYARMSRSYSLQVLATIVAVGCLLRALDKPSRRANLILAAAALAAVYTHYVPGLAVIAVANVAMLLRRRWKDALLMDAAVAAGLLPWAWWLAQSLAVWGRHGGGYAAIGGPSELVLKVAYWSMSFTAGEAVPDPILLVAMVLTPYLAWQFRGSDRLFAAITLALACIGFIGVARWVSYPFLPARLLFLLPLLLFLFASRAKNPALAALLVLFLAGDWCYFHKIGFRNKQYPMPIREIASQIGPQDTVLVDDTNSDPPAMQWALGPSGTVIRTTDGDAEQRLAASTAPAVWFLRNTHDVSADGRNARFERDLGQRMRLVRVTGYGEFSPLEQALVRRLGMANPPRYFSELLEFQR